MIRREVFELYMAAIADSCGRQYSDQTIDLYYELLNNKLDTEQFVEAAKRFVYEGGFFSPKALVEMVKPSVEVEAMNSWDLVFKSASRGQRPSLNEAGNAALKAVGGFRAVEMATENQALQMKKDFVKNYQSHLAVHGESEPLAKHPVLTAEPARLNGGGHVFG